MRENKEIIGANCFELISSNNGLISSGRSHTNRPTLEREPAAQAERLCVGSLIVRRTRACDLRDGWDPSCIRPRRCE